MKTITIFGGNEGSSTDLKDAEELGRRIGQRGYILKNGGYHGVMEASAKGCLEAGGKVIAVCIEGNFNNMVTPHQYATERIFAKNIDERIKELLKTDAVVVMPGGLGTLEELVRVWVKRAYGGQFPIYVYGQKNQALLRFLRETKLVQEKYLPLVEYVSHLDEINIL